MYKRRRILGTYLGVALAVVLLPGIHATADALPWELVLSGSIFLIVNQLIYTYPHDIRSARPSPLLVQGAIGIVQDMLIWLLVGWLSDQMQFGLHTDDFPTAVLGGVIVRASVLALLTLGPRPTNQAS